MEGEFLSLDKPQAREAAHQYLERDVRFELAERGAEAVVEPPAERECFDSSARPTRLRNPVCSRGLYWLAWR